VIETLLGALAAPREGASGATVLIIQMAAIFGIFYFLLIRPQQKEAARHRDMVNSVGKGAEIVTNGGIIGTVVEAKDDRLVIESAGTRLEIERGRIARVVDGKQGTPVAAKEDGSAATARPAARGSRGSGKGGRR
jgi:preprotein translocase subunit YajC